MIGNLNVFKFKNGIVQTGYWKTQIKKWQKLHLETYYIVKVVLHISGENINFNKQY